MSQDILPANIVPGGSSLPAQAFITPTGSAPSGAALPATFGPNTPGTTSAGFNEAMAALHAANLAGSNAGGTLRVQGPFIYLVTSNLDVPADNSYEVIGYGQPVFKAVAGFTHTVGSALAGVFTNGNATQGHYIRGVTFDANSIAGISGVRWDLGAQSNENSFPSIFEDVIARNAASGVYNWYINGFEDLTLINPQAGGTGGTGALAYFYNVPLGTATMINPKAFGKPSTFEVDNINLFGGSLMAPSFTRVASPTPGQNMVFAVGVSITDDGPSNGSGLDSNTPAITYAGQGGLFLACKIFMNNWTDAPATPVTVVGVDPTVVVTSGAALAGKFSLKFEMCEFVVNETGLINTTLSNVYCIRPTANAAGAKGSILWVSCWVNGKSIGTSTGTITDYAPNGAASAFVVRGFAGVGALAFTLNGPNLNNAQLPYNQGSAPTDNTAYQNTLPVPLIVTGNVVATVAADSVTIKKGPTNAVGQTVAVLTPQTVGVSLPYFLIIQPGEFFKFVKSGSPTYSNSTFTPL